MPGTKPGGQKQEWELFDCEKDPMELFNVWEEAEYTEVAQKMVGILEKKMAEIGDETAHKVGMKVEALRTEYPPTGAAKEGMMSQHNL